jgi:hypothetical protein
MEEVMRARSCLSMAISLLLTPPLLGQQKIWSADGARQGDYFGWSTDVLGDVDGDGVDEVLIGAVNAGCGPNSLEGSAYEYSLQGGLLDSWCGESDFDTFGASVAVIGDVDGDGIEDFAAASSGFDTRGGPTGGNNAGRVQVFSTRTGSVIYEVLGDQDFLVFGTALARLADLDGDGFAEMLVSAPGYAALGVNQGKAVVLSTKDGSIFRVHVGEAVNDFFGAPIAALGDVDGDGVNDYAIAARRAASDADKGRVYVYSGATGSELWRADGSQASDFFGLCISDGGDIDQDGIPDLLCSGALGGVLGTAGRVEARSGKDGALLFTLAGIQAQEQFGNSTALAGDVNDDGFGDYLIGAPANKHDGNFAGRAVLISGATQRPLFHFYPGYAHGKLGNFLRLGSDFDGDGWRDFVISAPERQLIKDPKGGRVTIFAANDLYLQFDPAVADVDDTVTMDVRGGAPGAFSIVFLTDIDGTSFFEPLVIGILDANGEMTEDFVVPSEAAGLDITFQAFATRRPKSPHFIDSSPFVVRVN